MFTERTGWHLVDCVHVLRQILSQGVPCYTPYYLSVFRVFPLDPDHDWLELYCYDR